MLKEYCQTQIATIDEALKQYLPKVEGPDALISESMAYSLFAGGKRLRPILLMASANALGQSGQSFLPVACALEMIHTYSLIHDDLPAMDNDDYRRGKLTNHKVYGDGIAVLAGDGLLTAAFEVMTKQEGVSPVILLQVIREIAEAAGGQGMIGGQVIDLLSEDHAIDLATLKLMHQKKTGALFKAAVRSGALLAGATPAQLLALTKYAEAFGLAFQITDDILDEIGTEDKIGKPVGSDRKNHKSTYVTLHSLEKAQEMAKEAVEEALDSIKDFGREAQVLRQLVQYLISRDN